MKADLLIRLETHARFRAAHNASPEELALLIELAATLPRPAQAFDLRALLRELYPDPMTLAMRRASQAITHMTGAIGKCRIKEAE